MGNENNSGIKLWHKYFKILGRKTPYYLLKDLKDILDKNGIKISETRTIKSEFVILNTADNRRLFTRFHLGDEHAKLISDAIIEMNLSEFIVGKYLNIPLEDTLLILQNHK